MDKIIRALIETKGRVNADEVGGKPPGTVLLEDFQATRQADGSLRTVVGLVHDPGGWNNIPGPDGLRYPVQATGTGKPIFESATFPPEGDGLTYQMRECDRSSWYNGWEEYWSMQVDEPVIVVID